MTGFIINTTSGRRVSILNDNDVSHFTTSTTPTHGVQAAARVSSAPATPELCRADSYDSCMTAGPVSPLTPLYEPVPRDNGAKTPETHSPEPHSPYSGYSAELPPLYAGAGPGPRIFSDGHSVPYEDQDVNSVASNRTATGTTTLTTATSSSSSSSSADPSRQRSSRKRFPCHHRDRIRCLKTFTTSGHASRHSKIHTGEKAIHCTFAGCTKKFTRSDNMKQHLQTHYKDKLRSQASRPGSRRAQTMSGPLAAAAEAASTAAAALAAREARYSEPLPSPVSGVWGPDALSLPYRDRPCPERTPSHGLAALALAAECQEAAEASGRLQ